MPASMRMVASVREWYSLLRVRDQRQTVLSAIDANHSCLLS
jgi:hypothetical protein